MTTISKIPIRTVFDANNSPLGLSEFQTGEVVSIEHGGTGANTTANARFNLSVDNVNVRALISVAGAGTYDNTTGLITIQTAAVTSVGGQTGAVSNAQLACSIISSGVLTTGNVGEVTNLYFTNTRAIGALSGGTGINIDANGLITSFVVGGVTSVGGATGAVSNAQLASSITSSGLLTTSNVSEGTNQYFTNARVQTYLQTVGNIYPSGNNIQDLGRPTNRFKDLYLSGNSIYLGTVVLSSSDDGKFAVSSSGTTLNVATSSDLTTANVTEVSNLYYTNARVYANVESIGYASNSYVNTRLNTKANVADLTTSNVSEGSNLYFTNARVYANVTALNYATTSHVASEIANLVNSAPSTLDTLNELASALNNDPSFATTTATLIGNSYNQANAAFAAANTKVSTVAGVTSTTISNSVIASGISQTGILTTANVSEVTNLYYTNARVYANVESIGYTSNSYVNTRLLTKANVADLTTANVTEVSNLYYTNARVYANVESIGYASNSYVNTRLSTKANVADLTTSNVSEGSNLYFTNTRSRAAISVTGAASYDNTTGVINVTGGVTSVGGATGAVSNAQLASSITSSGLLTTSNVSEGTNLYFSNARVYANVQSIGYASNSYVNSRFLTADGIKTLTNTTFDVSVSSNNIFSILGNQISSYTGSGSSVVLSQSPTISVLNISDSQMNLDGGSGIYYWGGQSGVAQAGDLKAGVYASDPSSNNSLFTFGTNGSNYMSVGVEGSLFVGTARPSNNGGLNTTYPGWLVVQSGGKFGGTINTLGALQFDDASTGKIIFADGTEQNTAFKTSVLTTANVSEVTNLYFTNARVYSNVVALNYATTSHVASEIANLVNSAPSTLNTLNELASALNNDPSFATTTATLIGNSYNQANAAFAAANTKVSTVAGLSSTTISNAALASGITSSGLLTTANVSEVTNLYFTNTRSIGALTGGSGVSIAANGLITSSVVGGVTSVGGATGAVSNAQILAAVQNTGYLTSANITEITNLYFTNTRAISALTEGSGINIDANGLITATVSAGVVNSFNTISVVNGAEGNIIASGSDTLKIETTGLITANTNPSTKTLSFTIGGNFPFFDSTGSQNNIALRVADSTVQSSVSFIYLPFSKSDGTSVNTLRYQ